MQKDTIVLHHSLTKDGLTVSWQAIRDYHVRVQKWRAIGYHFGIELIQNFPHIEATYEVLIGRMPHEQAAACPQQNMNRRGIHICLVGNFDNHPPPRAMWNRAVDLCASICLTQGISPARIFGHRDFATYKSCPGSQFDLNALRKDVQGRMP